MTCNKFPQKIIIVIYFFEKRYTDDFRLFHWLPARNYRIYVYGVDSDPLTPRGYRRWGTFYTWTNTLYNRIITKEWQTVRLTHFDTLTAVKWQKKKSIYSQMFCGLALKRSELPHGIFFFLFTSLKIFFAHFLPLKNTLGIVTEIHNIILYNSPLPEGNTF